MNKANGFITFVIAGLGLLALTISSSSLYLARQYRDVMEQSYYTTRLNYLAESTAHTAWLAIKDMPWDKSRLDRELADSYGLYGDGVRASAVTMSAYPPYYEGALDINVYDEAHGYLSRRCSLQVNFRREGKDKYPILVNVTTY